jgi:hypothetical protein
MRDIISYVITISGIKIMWTLALGNISLELTQLLIYCFRKIKFNLLGYLKYIIAHLSITHVLLRKAKKFDLICILFVYITYLCNNSLIKQNCKGIFKDFFTGYFNDLIAMIMLLAYFNISISSKGNNKRINKLHIILPICLIWGMLWENFAQIFNPLAVKDSLDVLCYCISGVIYFLLYSINECYEKKNNNIRTC